MLKANKIIKDLRSIHRAKHSHNLEIGVLNIIEALQPFEINFKALYKVDYNDVIYNDAQGNYESIDLDVKSDNSYNWNSQEVFNYNQIEVINKYGNSNTYITIKFHRFGDVRGNYTDYMVLHMDLEEFYDVLLEQTEVYAAVTINNNVYEINTDVFQENCIFRVYCDALMIDSDCVYLDIDNYRSIKDIKKAVNKWIKENN